MTASHNGVLKRKSSSAERAPRSPSPCTDPLCPLLPICTDPNCRYLECQSSTSQRKLPSTSSSTLNLLRNQQLTKAQMHTVPPSDDGAAAAGPQPPPPSSKVPPAQSQPKRKYVICHDCRYCAPLSCRNRKCLNAPKCNSLPRCAADFNRLRTTLTQPPASLYDTEPGAPAMQLTLLEQTTTAMAVAASTASTTTTVMQQPAAVTPSSGSGVGVGVGICSGGGGQRSNSQPNTLQRGESCALFYTAPIVAKRKHQNGHASAANGKLIKSASAVSLDERRRRHKTVHFGENLLREVCQNRKLIKYEQKPSGSQPSQTNGELLYNFVEGVLSAWHDDDDEDQLRSGAESEPEHGTMALKPLHRYDVIRYQVIKRVVNEAAELHGTLHLGNSRFRHRHWRSTAKQCNELFLRKISDDDRMSLTTAVSDEDDGESVMASPYKAKATGTAASSFNCTGAVRKAGFLSVKKWLLRKKHQIELARKRGWKGYWVCLKGTTLLFYPCDSREGRSVEAAPKHLIIVDGAIMQPIPEHPKRDYIFCLSTAFGDAYLFQAPCQVELENWVNSIHSACAAAFARHRGKTGTLHLLQEEIFRIEKAIESDHKLKHMAELQQSVVTDQDTRLQIQAQILQWEENLERLHCEQFRLRCYMASLQSGELPNPKSLLTHVSRPTKNTLNKLGVFTVSSFHAFICARSPSLLNNLLAGRGATKRRPPMLSRSNSGSSRRSMQLNSRDEPEKTFKVAMPDNAYSTVYLRDAMSVEEFLASACARRNLNPMEHFVRVKKRRDMEDHNYFVPHRNDLIENYLHNHEFVEVCMKILYQVELHRTTLEQMWGFSVEAELIENAERQDELCCYVSRVEDKSVAMQNGIIKGDEIMVINGAIVSDLDMMYLESVLQEEQSLSMMMRSSRTEPPDLGSIMRVTDDMIDSLVCPPPPTDPPVMSEEMITGLIVPAPGWNGTGKDLYSPEAESSPAPSFVEPSAGLVPGAGTKPTSRTSSFEIENLLKTAEQVTGFCRSPQETRKASPTGSVTSSVSNAALTPSRQLTDAEKLRKVILELVDTEKTYVKHLNNLLENYLEPLKRETFLSNAEINALFGNIHEIVTFQRQFLQNLVEALELEPDFHKFDHPSQYRNVLFAIGSAFLYYVNHFKLYSSFCASHSKAQKVLHPNEGNHALQEFLNARNPKQQHSCTLESYLIKPIQRILKYPLLLQQLRNLTDSRADEHLHLCEALKGMEKVAEHINEMQRIHEEYGAIFDHLFRQHQKACKQPIDLSPGDLLYYGGVEWLNISDFLGKIKKGLELHAMCFVFKSAVVFLCKERLRQKKKLMGVSSKSTPNEVEIIRYQVLIPVTEVQVRASSAKDMDSHFLWELIHLRSQLQRRSEKVYVLSNSTADFRNAFLKTIRQIIRESVRNMSIPMKNFGGSSGSVSGMSSQGGCSGSSQTLERPKQQITIMQGSQTLGKPKKKSGSQRHSAGNIDYDNISGSQEAEDVPFQEHHHMHTLHTSTFRSRSKTVGDASDIMGAAMESSQTQQQQHHHQQQQIHHHYQQQQQQQHQHHQQSQSDIERMDPGTKSEGEEEFQQGTIKTKASLGRTPNHLTLSTTSTLSVGSTGSQARLIQSSHPPSTYQPVLMKDLGSPVWKPRDMINLGDAPSTSRKDGSKNSRVEDKSVAMQNGIIKGDEIMVINGAIVSDLDMMYLESVLQEEQSLSMMMRSSRTEPPDLGSIMRVTDDMIDSLVCPPPPTDPPVMSEEMITGLIVPAPGWNGTGKDLYSPEAESSPAPSFVEPSAGLVPGAGTKPTSRTSSFEIENLLKTAEQVTGFCRSPQETRKASPTGSVTSSVSNAALTPSRQLTDAEKLRKVILELVDTEKTYVKHLNNLLENYLEPLKRETFLSNAEINALFGNIHEIVTFQRQFLQNLVEALELEPDFHKFDHPSQYRNVLFAIGSAFLYYVNHFKLYSSFCASHSKAQKVLHPNEGNHALQEFLNARNPKQQHSCTLESYLIKPIQRILKYPLLLQQLRNLTDSRADEHLHLCEALKGMEKVAEHINEMQRIHEEYGAIFDHLFRQHQKACKQPIDLSPGDLLYYGGVEWLNISDFLGKIKKGLELHAMCFVFKSAVVFLCKERLRQKKKLMGVSSKSTPNEVEIIRYQVLIPVTEVQVRASSAKDMDSHFLWELIHLRSQLQRRSEKVYVLSNSTADFRNAFLKTIRQIIRESVRNMSIPMKNFGGSSGSVSGMSSQGGCSGSSQTLERPKQQITIMQGSQTLGKPKKKSGSQRHSAGNIDYDNISGSQEAEDVPFQEHHHMHTLHTSTFRSRSKTVGDASDIMGAAMESSQTQQQQHHHQQQQIHHHYQQQQQQQHQHHQQSQSDIERMDPGTKSEGEEEFQQGTIKTKASLGRTPNHLTLSTTSTLSVGSTGSQARLIQSSHPPSTYQPVLMKDLGSPVWKPRDMINLGDAPSTSRKDGSKN
uniref:Still life n=1 Tax=Stomoxys calcitrans TaxID=35570 RepID=A0A1I8P3T1_STOCA